MAKKILLLGSTGKMGMAVTEAFNDGYIFIGKSSKDFDALNFEHVQGIIKDVSPDIVINTVAYLGIDPCEQYPERAFKLNTLYPKLLAELSNRAGFLLVHFSTDAVFNDSDGDSYTEESCPHPLNIYGVTKYGGDSFVQAIASRYYLLRISLLFGRTSKDSQFVEKMLQKVKEGQNVLSISNDIVGSPSYSLDIAKEVRRMIGLSLPYGLYHVANAGKASLYELIKAVVANLELKVEVKQASYKDFPYLGIKNTYTPISSKKISALRPWQDAVKAYCENMEKFRG